MGQLDHLDSFFDFPVFGDLALGELVDSVTTGGCEQGLILEAD